MLSLDATVADSVQTLRRTLLVQCGNEIAFLGALICSQTFRFPMLPFLHLSSSQPVVVLNASCLGVREFASEAIFESPGVSFVLPDVTCTLCNHAQVGMF